MYIIISIMYMMSNIKIIFILSVRIFPKYIIENYLVGKNIINFIIDKQIDYYHYRCHFFKKFPIIPMLNQDIYF